jgi:transposase
MAHCGLQAGQGVEGFAFTASDWSPAPVDAAPGKRAFASVNGKDPRQYGLDFGLWTRAMIASLIEQKFAVQLGLMAVGELLAKLGLTPQKPLERAYQRNPEAIDKWKRETYPSIANAAKAQGGEVYSWDESGFRADTVHGKTWGKKGETPVIVRPGQRQSISAASAVNAKGAFWYSTYQGGLKVPLFVQLLKQMMRHRTKPVHLVVDGLPAHKTRLVKEYATSTEGHLTLHFLPGYVPELNPDELVWSHVKRTGVSRTPLRKGEKLCEKIDMQLAPIKKMPGLVRAFFKTPSVAYIID